MTLPPSPTTRNNLSSPQLLPPPLPPDHIYTRCYCEENVYLLAQTFHAQSAQPEHAHAHSWATQWDVHVVFISNHQKTVALWDQKAGQEESGGLVVWDYHVVLVLRPLRPVASARRYETAIATGIQPGAGRGPQHAATLTPGDGTSTSTSTSELAVAAAHAHDDDGVDASESEFEELEEKDLDKDKDNDSRDGRIPGIEQADSEAWVYDFDSRAGVPCRWDEYTRRTFPYAPIRAQYQLDERYVSSFRVIPAETYLDHFASDRSHMIVLAGPGEHCDDDEHKASKEKDEQQHEGQIRYLAEPPAYPPLRGKQVAHTGVRTNLMSSFVSMLDWPSRSEDEDCARDARDGPGGAQDSDESQRSSTNIGDPALSVAPDGGEEVAVYGKVMDMSDFLRWISGQS